ncbi:MAG: 50S ribosomal protein L21e [Candidatus Nanoarchaeia archaeon]|nr:50S ribosomal protein L21e [Candidatus Nanoarchaeia archaeon]
MVQRIGGFRRKTRSKLRKSVNEKGKISLKNFLQKFKEGDNVCLKAEPAYQKGMYYPRFHGKNGKVVGKQGDCYNVLIKDGKKEKNIVVHPIHLRRL